MSPYAGTRTCIPRSAPNELQRVELPPVPANSRGGHQRSLRASAPRNQQLLRRLPRSCQTFERECAERARVWARGCGEAGWVQVRGARGGLLGAPGRARRRPRRAAASEGARACRYFSPCARPGFGASGAPVCVSGRAPALGRGDFVPVGVRGRAGRACPGVGGGGPAGICARPSGRRGACPCGSRWALCPLPPRWRPRKCPELPGRRGSGASLGGRRGAPGPRPGSPRRGGEPGKGRAAEGASPSWGRPRTIGGKFAHVTARAAPLEPGAHNGRRALRGGSSRARAGAAGRGEPGAPHGRRGTRPCHTHPAAAA